MEQDETIVFPRVVDADATQVIPTHPWTVPTYQYPQAQYNPTEAWQAIDAAVESEPPRSIWSIVLSMLFILVGIGCMIAGYALYAMKAGWWS